MASAYRKARILLSILVLATIFTISINHDIVNASEQDSSQWRLLDLVQYTGSLLDHYWKDQFQKIGFSFDQIGNAKYYTEVSYTACGPLGMRNAYYCALENSVYYDYYFLREILHYIGDFAIVVILAHEWAHSVEYQLNPDSFMNHWIDGTTKLYELWADCAAGVFSQYLLQNGFLEKGDYQEAIEFYSHYVGSSHSHGTASQRITAFKVGYRYDLDECSFRIRSIANS